MSNDINNVDIVQQYTALKDANLVETYIKMIGDKSTICQIIKLLAYIRHTLQNKEQATIQLKVGSKVNSDFFGFQVNDSEIKDYLTQNYIEIN